MVPRRRTAASSLEQLAEQLQPFARRVARNRLLGRLMLALAPIDEAADVIDRQPTFSGVVDDRRAL